MTKPYFKGKSAEIARQKRTEGNKAFQQKDYPKAVQLYSDAILRAPFVNDNGKLLCTAATSSLHFV